MKGTETVNRLRGQRDELCHGGVPLVKGTETEQRVLTDGSPVTATEVSPS